MFFAFSTLVPSSLPGRIPSDEGSIQRLVRECREGSSQAARALYDMHVASVFRTVRPLCRSDDEAYDTVQEAFTRSFEALDRYQPQPGTRFISWLLTIALNVARKTLRSRKRLDVAAEAQPPEQADLSEGLDEQLDRMRIRVTLLALMNELPPRDREILTLRYGGELSSSEVAAACGTSEDNVRKICERQRRRLLGRLKAQGWQPDAGTDTEAQP